MAPLTWRNVDAPNFAGSNDLLKTAAALMNQGFDSARQGISDFRKTTTDEQSAALMQSVIAAGNDPAAIAAATAGANPAFMSPDALRFANNQGSVLLDREGKALQNTGEGLQNTVTGQNIRLNDFQFDRKQIEAQRTDQAYAGMPTALAEQARLNAELASGDVARVQAAEAAIPGFLSTHGRTLGINDGGAFVRQGMQTEADGQSRNVARIAYGEGMDKMLRSKDVDNITNNIISMVGSDMDAATKLIQNAPDMDVETRTAVLTKLNTYKSVLPQKTAAQQALEATGAYTGETDPITLQKNDLIGEVLANPGKYEAVVMKNNGTRNKPLSPNLNAALNSVLPGLGLQAEVISGGQDGKGEGTRRTGSTRHDHGNAADVKFKDMQTGRVLSWERPADVPKLQAAAAGLKGAGLTGFGAGPGYMNPETTHVGFGSEAVWGDKGGKPYQALLDAFSGGQNTIASKGPTVEKAAAMKAAPQYQAAMDAVARGENYEAPIDTSRPQLQNDDGTISTERTFTTEVDGMWLNIPSIVGGKELPEEQAIAEFRKGTNPAVGVFQMKRDAEAAAETRSENIGKAVEAAPSSSGSASATAQTGVGQTAETEVAVPIAPERVSTTPDNYVTVDSTASASVQDGQRRQRESSINNDIVSLIGETRKVSGNAVTNVFGSAWDYFTATPEEGAANEQNKDAAYKAADIIRDNADYFRQNPDQIAAAKSDPIGYANNFGKLDSQKAYLSSKTKVAESLKDPDAEKPAGTAKTDDATIDKNYVQRELTAAESVTQMFNTVGNMAIADDVNDTDAPINEAIRSNNKNKDVATVVDELTKTMTGVERGQLLNAVNDLVKADPGITPSIAGALLKSNQKYDSGWFEIGDSFKADIPKALEQWKRYQSGPSISGTSNMVLKLNNDEGKSASVTKFKETQAQYEAQEKIVMDAIAVTTDPVERATLERRLAKIREAARAKVKDIYDKGDLTRNLATQTGR